MPDATFLKISGAKLDFLIQKEGFEIDQSD